MRLNWTDLGSKQSWVGSFPRTKREVYSVTKIYLIWILSVIFEFSATLWLFATKYLSFGADVPKVIQVQWKLSKQKDFYILTYGSFNQNRHSLCSNVVGGRGDKWLQHLMTRWRWRHKYYRVILVPGIFSATCFYDPTTSWSCKQPNTKIWLVHRFKPRRFENIRFFLIWPVSAKPDLGSLTTANANSVSFDLIVSCSFCWG